MILFFQAKDSLKLVITLVYTEASLSFSPVGASIKSKELITDNYSSTFIWAEIIEPAYKQTVD